MTALLLRLAVASPCATIKDHIIGNGHDLAVRHAASQSDCCASCQTTPHCAAWTYHPNGECWLHSSAENWVPRPAVVSGVPGGKLPPAPPPPAPMGGGGGYGCNGTASRALPFCDRSLSFEARAADLASRVFANESARQMTARQCEPLPRLDVPSN